MSVVNIRQLTYINVSCLFVGLFFLLSAMIYVTNKHKQSLIRLLVIAFNRTPTWPFITPVECCVVLTDNAIAIPAV